MVPALPGSRFLNGTLELHLEADRRLAEFVGKEAALVFSTGYQTNLGTVSALLGKNDFAILDKDVHACVVDGVNMSRGQMKRFKTQRRRRPRPCNEPGACRCWQARGRRWRV